MSSFQPNKKFKWWGTVYVINTTQDGKVGFSDAKDRLAVSEMHEWKLQLDLDDGKLVFIEENN